jgi:hypothetical protein
MILKRHSIRNLDQSYAIPAQTGSNGSWTAGSELIQQPVEQSIKELKQVERRSEQAAKKQSQRLEE